LPQKACDVIVTYGSSVYLFVLPSNCLPSFVLFAL
jgi:hypothetical protein